MVLDQLEMMRLRNTSNAFNGILKIEDTPQNELNLTWASGTESATLQANLKTHHFSIYHENNNGESRLYQYPR